MTQNGDRPLGIVGHVAGATRGAAVAGLPSTRAFGSDRYVGREVDDGLNYVANQTIPNTVIVKVGASGGVCIFNQQAAHIIADVSGFFPD